MKKTTTILLAILIYIPFLSADTTWTGAINNDWWNPSNWTAGLPSPGNNAIIPDKAMYTHDPEINSLVPAAFNITNSGCLIITSSGALQLLLTSFLTNYGTINNSGEIFNQIAGTITNDSGTLNNTAGSTLINSDASTIENINGGTITVDGMLASLNNSDGGTFINNGANSRVEVKNSGIIWNTLEGSTIENQDGAVIEVSNSNSLLNNSLEAVITNSGTNTVLIAKDGGKIWNESTGTTILNKEGAKLEIKDAGSELIHLTDTIRCIGTTTTLLVHMGGQIRNEGVINIGNSELQCINGGILENHLRIDISYGMTICATSTLNFHTGSSITITESIFTGINSIIKGCGSIIGQVSWGGGGLTDPGESPGILNFTGKYIHSDSTTYRAEIESNAGAGAGHDQLQADTVILQNGILEVVLLNGFTPMVGDLYDIMTFTSLSGTFDSLMLPVLTGGNSWAVHYHPTNLTLEVLGPLPVELTFFSANKKGNTSLLEWQTASEINFDYFVIEHSTDGKQFRQIGRLAGNGTSTGEHDYSFVDERPKTGDNYYRLRQVDRDESFRFSAIEHVRHYPFEKITIYPSIARDYLILRLHDSSISNVSIELFDVNGRQMKVNFVSSAKGIYQVDISHLETGSYLIRVEEKGEQFSSRFVKL